MIIIYYRNKDGKISHYHAVPESKTLQEWQVAVAEFNIESTDGRTAYIQEVKDDSLTAYLFQKADERKKWDKESLLNAISSIEDALYAVRELEG